MQKSVQQAICQKALYAVALCLLLKEDVSWHLIKASTSFGTMILVQYCGASNCWNTAIVPFTVQLWYQFRSTGITWENSSIYANRHRSYYWWFVKLNVEAWNNATTSLIACLTSCMHYLDTALGWLKAWCIKGQAPLYRHCCTSDVAEKACCKT